MRESPNCTELRLESIKRRTILSVDDRITMCLPELMNGGYLRSCDDGRTEVSLFDSPSQETLRKLVNGNFGREGSHFRDLCPEVTLPDNDYLEIVSKLRLYSSYLREHRCVTSTSMLYLEFRSRRSLLKTDSSSPLRDSRHVIIFNVVASLRREDRSLSLMKSFCFSGDDNLTLSLTKDQLVRSVLGSYADEESELMDLGSGRYSCVFNPETTSYLLHEMLGHLLEADLIYNHPLLLEGKLKLGSPISTDCVSFIDDPTIEGYSGHYSYDDEGVPAKKVELLTEGRVTGHLNGLETARLLKAVPNGHARTIDYHFLPFVRMSTTYPQPGRYTTEEMISGIDKGIYIEDSMLAKNDLENFILIPKEIYLIEKGRITGQLAPLTVFGNIFEFLRNILAVGSDLKFYEAGCTKGYADAWIPVTTGGCSLYVKDVRVGGSIL